MSSFRQRLRLSYHTTTKKLIQRLHFNGKWQTLTLVATAELFAMTLWFSVSAVAPGLAAMWDLTSTEAAWLTISVQVGFVAGALLSAILTLADIFRPRYLFAGSALVGATATAIIAGFVHSLVPALFLRFLTGVALAGVYPTGMKMVAGWFRVGRGFGIGILVGALAIGSAAPYLLRIVGSVGHPQAVLYGSAAISAIGGLIVLFYEEPNQASATSFDPSAIRRILQDRGTALSNIGYFGHMWELYAVWTWLPFYLNASFTASGIENPLQASSLLTFGTIAIGGIGAWLGGSMADRWGRTTVTSISMSISGLACLAAGPLFGARFVLLVPFCLIWGFFIIADSAQFSACISEFAKESYVGSALTLQTAIGFLITTISIQLIPIFQGVVGWQWVFAPLALGPTLGTAAMLRLRTIPVINELADGRG